MIMMIIINSLNIYNIQHHLQLAGAASFYGYPEGRLYMLIICAVLLLGFGTLTRKMKPCLVKKVNPLEMGGYFLAGNYSETNITY